MELYFFARFQTKPDHSPAFEALLPKLLTSSRGEPGCIRIRVFRSLLDPNLFFIHSLWKD